MLFISGLAALVGAAGAVLAWVLLELIRLATNVFYYQRFSFALSSPAGNKMGWGAALMPVIGGVVVGVMARYGSQKIRGAWNA